MDLKLGDLVRLKSGGVSMVVINFSDDRNYVKCLWQDVTSSGTLPREYNFPILALESMTTSTPEASSAAREPASEAETSPITESDPIEAKVEASPELTSSPDASFAQPAPRRSSWLSGRA